MITASTFKLIMLYYKIFICSIILFSSTISYGQLFEDCFTAELVCDLNDFPNGDEFDLPSSGTTLSCHGTDFPNPLFMRFMAGPGDVTFSALALSCTPGSGNTGLIMGVWEACPGFFPSDCIALTECFNYPLGLGNIPRELVVDDVLLEDGRIYYFVISGCEGAECSFSMEVDGNSLEVPDLDDGEIDFQVFECTKDNLPQYNYCVGATVEFTAENDIYNNLRGEWYWSIEELSSDADADQVSWFGNARMGTGNPVSNGSYLFLLYGDNKMNFTFNRPGTYNICVDEFRNPCNIKEGPICQEVTIISPPPIQELGYFNLCYRDVEFQGWEGPDLPNALGQEWLGGNLELSDILSSPQDDDDYYIIERRLDTNDCGCSYTQYLYVNLVGDEPPGEAELFLSQCQLPYEWFDITFFDINDFQGQELVLVGGANEADYNGVKCDSFVFINVNEIIIPDTIIFDRCANMEYLYTFEIDDIEVEIDNDIEDISFTGLRYQWIDSLTGISLTPLTDNPTTALSNGTYYVSVTGFMDDVNHNENSVNTSPNSFVNCLFGPYTVDNPVIPTPTLEPYDNVLCDSDNSIKEYRILNPDPELDYKWILPNNLISRSSYNADSTILFVNDIRIIGNQQIGIFATSDCGISETFFFDVSILPPITITTFPSIESCINDAININYNSNTGDTFIWTLDGATTLGNTTDGSPFQLTYATPGDYTYSYTVTDNNGCSAESPLFNISIYQSPQAIIISCVDDLDPGNITFEWDTISTLSYEVNVISPPSLQGIITGNQINFENLNPGTEIEISITATSNGPVNCNSVTTNYSCITDDCDLDTPVRNNFIDLTYCQNSTMGNLQFDVETASSLQGSYIGQGISSDGLLNLDDPQYDIPGQYMIIYNYTDDAMTCVDQIEIIINIIPEINIEDITITDICKGDSIRLQPTISGSTNDYIYSWEPDDSSENFIDITTDDSSSPGNYQVTLTVTDANNICQSTRIFDYTVIEPIPNVLEFNSVNVCNELPGDFPIELDFTSIQNVDGTWYDQDDMELTTASSYSFEGIIESDLNFYFVPDNNIPCLDAQYDLTVTVSDCGCPDISLDTPLTICSPLSGSDSYILSASIDGSWSAADPNVSIISGNQLIVDSNSASGNYAILFSIENPTTGCITETTVIISIEQNIAIEFNIDQSVCHIDNGSGTSILDLDNILITNSSGTWSSLNNEFIIEANNTVDFDGADIQTYTFFYEIPATGICPAVSYPIDIRVRDCSCPDLGITNLPQLCTSDPILTLDDYLINPELLDGEWTIDGQASDGLLNPELFTTETYDIQFQVSDPIGGDCDSVIMNSIIIYQSTDYTLLNSEMTFCNSQDNMEHPFSIDLLSLSNNIAGAWSAPLNYNDGMLSDTSRVSFDGINPGLYSFNFTPFIDPNSPCENTILSFVAEVIDCACPPIVLQDLTLCNDAVDLFDLDQLIVDIEGAGNWSLTTGPTAIDIEQSQLIDITDLAGDYTFSYTLQDVNPGCDNVETAIVTIQEQYPATALPDITACNRISSSYNYNFDLTALINFPGEWIAPSNYITTSFDASDINFLDQEIGVYTFTFVTEANSVCNSINITQVIEVVQCCDEITYIVETEPACPEASNGSISLIIENSSTIYTYSIDDGITFSEQNTFSNLSAGPYSIIIQDEESCEIIIDNIIVEEYDLLDINLGSDIRIAASNTPYQLDVDPSINPADIDNITWLQDGEILCEGNFDECSNLEVDINQSTTICIEVIDTNDCLSNDCVTINEVIPQRIYIPNTFNPANIDDKYFYIGADEFVESITAFNIYDRWGELIFIAAENYEVNTPELGWDGSYNGEVIDQGVYVYFIKVKFIGEVKEEIYSGTITLLR